MGNGTANASDCNTDMPDLKIIRLSDIRSEPVAWLLEPFS